MWQAGQTVRILHGAVRVHASQVCGCLVYLGCAVRRSQGRQYVGCVPFRRFSGRHAHMCAACRYVADRWGGGNGAIDDGAEGCVGEDGIGNVGCSLFDVLPGGDCGRVAD